MTAGRRSRRLRTTGVVLGVLVVVDLLSGLVYRTGTTARVSVLGARTPGHRVVVVLPGHVMPGGLVGRAFLPHLRADDSVVAVDWAQRGMDLDALYRDVRREVAALAPSSVVVYAASMGGLVAAELLRRAQADGLPFGRVALVLDASPGSAASVRRPGALFALACVYRGGVVSSLVWAAASALAPKPPVEPGADRALVDEANAGGAWVGLPAVTSQACFINGFRALAPAELDSAVTSATYLHGVPQDGDPSIDTAPAVAAWRIGLLRLVEQPIPTRQAGWHVPLVERPAETVTALEQAVAGRR